MDVSVALRFEGRPREFRSGDVDEVVVVSLSKLFSEVGGVPHDLAVSIGYVGFCGVDSGRTHFLWDTSYVNTGASELSLYLHDGDLLAVRSCTTLIHSNKHLGTTLS